MTHRARARGRLLRGCRKPYLGADARQLVPYHRHLHSMRSRVEDVETWGVWKDADVGADVIDKGEREIEGIVSDLDGVVYRGDTPVPDAVLAFRHWRERGVPYAFVTNNATKSADQFAAKLVRMGVAAEPAQVFNVVAATARLVRRRWPAGTRVFAIGERPLFEALEAAGLAFGGEDASVVVLGFDYGLTYAKLRTAVRCALAGAAVVVTNPDRLAPAADGFEPCVGVLQAAVQAAVPSIRPIVVGKPEPHMIEDALGFLGTARERTIMIGDQIATDIAAGNRAGLRSILVTTGVPAAPDPALTPDRVIGSLLELVDTDAARAL